MFSDFLPPPISFSWASVDPLNKSTHLQGTLTVRVERQSARMSKITNDRLTRSRTGCFIAVPIMATVGVKGLMYKREAAVFTETAELEDEK